MEGALSARACLFACLAGCLAFGAACTPAEGGGDLPIDSGTDDGAIEAEGDLGADTDFAETAPADTSPADTAKDSGPPPIDRSKCTASPDAPGATTRSVTVSGTTMKYVAYAPSGYVASVPSTVVLALHGAGDTADNYLSWLWRGVADGKKVLVVVPEASKPLGSGFTWMTSDADAIIGTLEDFAHCYSVDPKRQIIHGFSAGGIMAYWIGLADAGRFAGISIASADEGSAQAISGTALLPAAWKIPVSHFHGLTDTNFPIASARAGRDRLLAAGHKVYWHEFAGGHTTNATDASTMLDDLATSRAP